MATVDVPPGGYRFIPGVFQYSAGVAALDGFRIERAMFVSPLPLAAGFARIDAYLAAIGRPRAAFCACELRSPEPMSEAAFQSFNERYVATLSEWGIIRDGLNPVARSNVCPEVTPPAEPSFHAFSFTVPTSDTAASFVVAGSGEVPEGKANYRDHIVRPGDTSAAGLLAKATFVLDEMERRMSAIGFGWGDVTATQVYSVRDIHPLLASVILPRGAAANGITWHYCRPPVAGLDFEMDCRGIAVERAM
ncbi:MAG TPA: hypothetical protein VFK86_20550 [Bauldia sp.]|nr:hypothetical protein [Bauldia sp.]